MDILTVVLAAFGLLELANVLLLYLAPGSRRGNSMGFFNAYQKAQSDPEISALVNYLVNWVAGTKLIFIVLLIGVLIAGDATIKVFATIALVFSIMTFYTRLYPALKKMDEQGQITPHGYSRTLGIMIAGFIVTFTVAVIVYLANYRVR